MASVWQLPGARSGAEGGGGEEVSTRVEDQEKLFGERRGGGNEVLACPVTSHGGAEKGITGGMGDSSFSSRVSPASVCPWPT